MTISRSTMLKQLLPGLNALFQQEYRTYQDEHKAIFEIDSSERSFEEEQALAAFGAAPVKSEGAAILYDDSQETYAARYNHETVAMGFSITEEAMEDNLYESLSKRNTKYLARSMAYTKQVKCANILNNGFSDTGGDGVSLFNTAHPRVVGTVANRPSTDADLNETSLENAVIDIANFADERGLLIAARPKRLIIPTELQFTATRILESEGRVDTADNDLNALRNNGSIPEGYFVNHYLTDSDAWFIITDVPDGLKHFQRVKMQTGFDSDFDTGNTRYKARERYSQGYSDALGAYGTSGAA